MKFKSDIQAEGKVGIGVTNPGSRLEVAGEIDATTGDGYKINGKPWANNLTNVLNLGDWDGEGFSTIIYDENSRGVVKIKDYGTTINTSGLSSSYGSRASLAVGTIGNESAGAGVITLANNDTTASAGDPTGAINFAIKADTGAGSLGYTSAIISGSIFANAGTGNAGGGILDFKTSPIGSGNSPQTRIRIDQLGDVGIGTTSPDAKLEVSSINGGVLRLTSSDTSVATGESIGRVEFKSNDASTGGNNVMGFVDCLATNAGTTYALTFGTGNAAAATEKMRINPNGNVGIGATNPSDKLVVQGDGDGILVRSDDFTLSRIIPRGQTSTNWDKALFSLYNANTESVRIDTSGSTWFNGGFVGINDTTPSYQLDVRGDGRFTSDLRCLSLIQTSQSDKKEYISDIVKTTNKKIEFKEYVYKSDSGNRKRYGVLAEDIEVDYPELVHIDADGVKGVNYIDLLVKRVAELEKELEDISLTEGPKGDTGSRGLRGYTGTSGSSGTNGADGKDGNSHLSDVSSIRFSEKSGQLEIRIGRETYRFNQDK